jgi:HPt (histidine-containing phosphotransfer) domain-containing protein
MDSASKEKLEERLKILKQMYAAQLPARLQEIKEKWDIARKKWNAENLKNLERLVHNLTGSGATFGFPEITNQARELELYLKEFFLSLPSLESKEAEIQTKLDQLIFVMVQSSTNL